MLPRRLRSLKPTVVEGLEGEGPLPGLGLNIARYNAGGHAWRAVPTALLSPHPGDPEVGPLSATVSPSNAASKLGL